MTWSRYALTMGILTAVTAMVLGAVTGNPHWLSLNLPCGFIAGAIGGAIIYPFWARH